MILVTGATGLLGSQICKLLEEKEIPYKALKRIDSDTSLTSSLNIQWVEGDITDIASLDKAMEGVDTVIHSAALVSFDKKDDSKMMNINVIGTQNVVNCAIDQQVTNFIHISSIAALGRSKRNKIIDENTKWEDSSLNTTYAKSKYLSELEVRRGETEGLKVAILNPSVILAAADGKRSSSQLVEYAWKERLFCLDGFANLVDVLDVAKVTVNLLNGKHWGERFILCSYKIHYRELFGKLASLLNKNPPRYSIKPQLLLTFFVLIKLIAILSGRNIIVSKALLKTMKENFTYNADKIRNAMGFEFCPIDESLQRATNDFLKINK